MKMDDFDKRLTRKNRSHLEVRSVSEPGLNNIEVLKAAINALMEKTKHLESEICKLKQLIDLYPDKELFDCSVQRTT